MHSDQPDDHLDGQSPCNPDSLGAAYWCCSFHPWQEAIWAFRFFILLKGWLQDLHPSTQQKKGPFLAGFWLQVVICSLIDFLTPNHFAQKGQTKTSSSAGCSGPWVNPYVLSQSLLCSILLTTLLTNELRSLDAAFLVSLQHVAASQQLGTIATGGLLPPVDIHMLP